MFRRRLLAPEESFRKRNAWQGVIDGDALARMAYALERKRTDQACKWFPWWESIMLWKWAECGEHCADNEAQRQAWRGQLGLALEYVFPPAAAVPANLLTWARNVASVLTPAEVDYLAAMFVCVAHPWRKYDVGEQWASHHAYGVLLSRPREDEDVFRQVYAQGDAEGLRGIIEDHADSAGRIIPAPFAEVRHNGKNDMRSVRAPASLLSASAKGAKDRKEQGQGKPTAPKVAMLLGIDRRQATRLVQRIKRKLGKPGVYALFELLGAPAVPHAWKVSRSEALSRRTIAPSGLTCPACGALIADTDTTCPDCEHDVSML